MWYGIGSFFLPVFGLIGTWLFKKFRYMRNYRMCRKGTIGGFATLGAILAFFGILFLIAGL